MDNLTDVNYAGTAYKVRFYDDEDCTEINEYVVLADSVKEAAEYAEGFAFSQFHILSVDEIGYTMVGIDKIEANMKRFAKIIKKEK